MDYYHKGLKIWEEIGSSPDEATASDGEEGAASALNNLGYIYEEQGDIESAYFSRIRGCLQSCRTNTYFSRLSNTSLSNAVLFSIQLNGNFLKHWGMETKQYASAISDSPRVGHRKLKGKQLVIIIFHLVEYYGWKQLESMTSIKSFGIKPSYQTVLKYLKKTPSARRKVERLYLNTVR